MSQSRGRGIGALLLANLRASPGKSTVLGVGAIVLVVLLVRLFTGGKPAEAGAAAPDAPVMAPAADAAPESDAASKAEWIPQPRRPRPRVRQMPARDPFSLAWLGTMMQGAADGAESVAGGLALQMILTGGDNGQGYAVISGMVVHVGSTVGRYQVMEIAERHVVLRDQSETLRLRMP